MSKLLYVSFKYCFLFFVSSFFVLTATASLKSLEPFRGPISLIPSAGEVLSIERGGGYSFIEAQITSPDTIFLASANLPDDVEVGNTVTWDSSHLAENYYSHALDRTFLQLYMVTFKQAQVETGVIEALNTIGANTYLAVTSEQKKLMLVLNINQIKPGFLQGAKIEWLRADSQPYLVKLNTSDKTSFAVEWIHIAPTER
jgi:hypothetical protein